MDYRFSEKAFRFYEPMLATIVGQHPKLSLFDPVKYGVSTETFRARIRDAMRSFMDNQWPSQHLAYPKFREIYPYLKVSTRRNLVYVGTKKALDELGIAQRQEAFAATGTYTDPSVPVELDLSSEPIKDFHAFRILCKLADKRHLRGPVRISLPPKDAEMWQTVADDSFDIDLAPTDEPLVFILT